MGGAQKGDSTQPHRLQKTADLVTEYGRKSRILTADLSDLQDVQKLAQDSLAAWGFFNRQLVSQWTDKPMLYPVYRLHKAITSIERYQESVGQ